MGWSWEDLGFLPRSPRSTDSSLSSCQNRPAGELGRAEWTTRPTTPPAPPALDQGDP